MKQIEDAALAVHRHVHRAASHASAGDYPGRTPKPSKPRERPASSRNYLDPGRGAALQTRRDADASERESGA
jgi:hypothetical protein